MSPPIYTPDGSEVSEIVLPDGSTASEVIGPDGNVVFEAGPDIPDSVVTQYRFEDDSNTSIAIDSIGSNDADLTGPTYTTTSKVGSLALSMDGSDDELSSQNAVDLVADGPNDAVSLSAWVYPRDTAPETPLAWWTDQDNMLTVQKDGGNWRIFVIVNDSFVDAVGSAVQTNTWTHVYAELTQSDITLKLDGSVDAQNTHNSDITNLGPMRLRSGHSPFGNYGDHIVNDFAAANDTLTDGELSALIARGGE